MLAKLTAKNQITIPKSVMNRIPRAEYFEVSCQNGVVTLKPVTVASDGIAEIREKMRKLGLTNDSVAEAVEWARQTPPYFLKRYSFG